MADVAPAGPVSVAVDGLRTLIANIPFFQTWTGAPDAATALNSIFVGEVGYPIVSIMIAGGVATVTTRDVHQIAAGATVTLQGASIGAESTVSLDGTPTVVSVTADSFTFATLLPDQTTLLPDQAFVFAGTRPIAVVSEGEDSVHSDSIGTGGASVYAGAVEILLEADVSAQYQNDSRNALFEARNAFGQFIQGLAATQGTLDLMCTNRIEPISGPEFTSRTEQDDNTVRFERWRALIRVTWGLDG